MTEPCLFVIGATHHSAPVEVRERLAVGSEELLRRDLASISGLRELAILVTCNRVEFYGVGEDERIADEVQAVYCARQRFDPREFQKIRIRLTGMEAALHLFEVASGVDSQLVGENEIFGQVKDAYAAAQALGTTGAVLNRVFQKAFQAAKHVRTHTGISSGRVSIANVAVDLATSIFGSLEEPRVLILGTGEIGEGTARAFHSRGAERVKVSGRNAARAAEIAGHLGAGAVPFASLDDHLGDFDVVVCSTAAPEAVVRTPAIAAAMRRRPARPLLLIDLAVPRDVEPAAANLENVFLYNLDDLARIADSNRAAREAEVSRCRALLGERAAGLWEQVRRHLAQEAAPPAPSTEAGAPRAAPAPPSA